MRWSILLLIFLGLVAALSASLLAASLNSRNVRVIHSAPKEPVVLVARRMMEPLTVVRADDVTTRTAGTEAVQPHHLTDPLQAIGRSLIVPMEAGQVLTRSSFMPSGAGAELITTLKPGFRAVMLSLPPDSSLQGLLYAGGVVDVQVAFRVGGGAGGEALSTTLLEQIQVLSINDEIVGVDSAESQARPSSSAGRRNLLITLMVDSRQAKALQLAHEYGTILLTMRNPTDAMPVDSEAMLLSRGQMARMATMLETQVTLNRPGEVDRQGPFDMGEWISQTMQFSGPAEPQDAPDPGWVVEPEPVPVPASAPDPGWQIEILRAGASEVRSFPSTQ